MPFVVLLILARGSYLPRSACFSPDRTTFAQIWFLNFSDSEHLDKRRKRVVYVLIHAYNLLFTHSVVVIAAKEMLSGKLLLNPVHSTVFASL